MHNFIEQTRDGVAPKSLTKLSEHEILIRHPMVQFQGP